MELCVDSVEPCVKVRYMKLCVDRVMDFAWQWVTRISV
jgi:hypothetical protein